MKVTAVSVSISAGNLAALVQAAADQEVLAEENAKLGAVLIKTEQELAQVRSHEAVLAADYAAAVANRDRFRSRVADLEEIVSRQRDALLALDSGTAKGKRAARALINKGLGRV